jgi:hypothetical protein
MVDNMPAANASASREGESQPAANRLADMFYICSYGRMERIEARRISDILVEAPLWARLGLAIRDARLRTRAADCIAARIVERRDAEEGDDPDQFRLL